MKIEKIETKVISGHTVNITKDRSGMFWAEVPSIPDRHGHGMTLEDVVESITDEIDVHYEMEKECRDST